MKKLKKIILSVMCLGLIACFVACNADGESMVYPDLPNQSEQESAPPPNQDAEENNGGGDDANNSESNGGLTLPEQGWTDVRK
jgi:hypothetical protein